MYGTYEDLFRSNDNFIDMMNVIKMSTEIKMQNENESFKNTSTKRKSSKTIVRRLSSIKSTTSSMVIITYIFATLKVNFFNFFKK